MLDVFVLALALSMDAFAVAIGLGAKRKTDVSKLALMTGAYFGFFQGLMPFFGYWAGKGIIGWVAAYAPWVAFTLLLLIGLKMIYESFQTGIEEQIKATSHQVMVVLAIATSIDAMVAGFALTLLNSNVIVSCAVIGLTTFLFSYAGVLIGAKSGTQLENKAEFFGGTVLILIGLKILLT
jgi:manganese efflux pump family protein